MRIFRAAFLATICLLTFLGGADETRGQRPSVTKVQSKGDGHSLELTRAVRPWEFLSALGQRAGLLGNEAGRMEAWVYPLKIFRDFHLKFHVDGRALEADSLARTLITRPESSTIVYAGDTFSVKETFFVPVKEPGAVILFEVETESPLEIEAVFHRDFALEWPAGLGSTYNAGWDATLRGFVFGEEQRKFAAAVGSPTGTYASEEFEDNFSQYHENSFRLGATAKGKERKLIVIAGSMNGRPEAETTYRRLAAGYADMLKESAEYYRKYLAETVNLELPDKQIQDAYDWARVSLVQGMVTNPFLGTGLVAGYRTSGESQRPGFAWYFGRDSFWSSLALNAEGDFANTKTALEFVSKFQREDGKIPHEISQGASFVDWFKGYPYAYASADATPLYIIAANDYVTSSGDAAFAKEKWESLWKAYQFLKSTYGARGLPQNLGFGHGWVEGGPLLPVKTEFYQSRLGAEALRALADLARFAGHDDAAEALEKEFEKQRALVNEAFWIADKKRFAFALDQNDKQVDQLSVLAAAPMWWGSTTDNTASEREEHLRQLASPDIQADWGMRIISDKAPIYSGGGYHYGSVWPLFTGWASVAEYRYHQDSAAYQNLRANALLALDGSLGHVAEVLSGDYYQPLSTNSPHQIWSAAMVISPVLKGMLGLEADAMHHTLTFAPHVPADWTDFEVENAHLGNNTLLLNYRKEAEYSKTQGGIVLIVGRTSGSDECTIEFRPAISLHARVQKVELNGKPFPFRVESNGEDQHVVVRFAVKEGRSVVSIFVQNDFGVSENFGLPPLGGKSEGLRILSQTWTASRDQLTLEVSGAAGHEYKLEMWNGGLIQKVEGAESGQGWTYWVHIPKDDSEEYPHAKIVIHLWPKVPPG